MQPEGGTATQAEQGAQHQGHVEHELPLIPVMCGRACTTKQCCRNCKARNRGGCLDEK
jgi:hypothetical protein